MQLLPCCGAVTQVLVLPFHQGIYAVRCYCKHCGCVDHMFQYTALGLLHEGLLQLSGAWCLATSQGGGYAVVFVLTPNSDSLLTVNPRSEWLHFLVWTAPLHQEMFVCLHARKCRPSIVHNKCFFYELISATYM